MKRLLSIGLVLSMLLTLTACGGSPAQPESSEPPLSSQEAEADGPSDYQIRVQDANDRVVVFQLNDSPAARSLYEQLPLSIEVENYGDNEKIFYPPEKLDTEDTPLAEGGVGTLAYYSPWGDVVMFYREAGPSSGLYELGEAIVGDTSIQELSGAIRVEAVTRTVKSATGKAETQISSSHAASDTSPAAQPQDSSEKEDATVHVELVVGNQTFTAELYQNETARALVERMPMTVEMQELNGNEKFCYLSHDLPTNSKQPSEIHVGDLMLFGPDCLVLFYQSFSTAYRYTPLGYIANTEGLAAALGSGAVHVSFQIAE